MNSHTMNPETPSLIALQKSKSPVVMSKKLLYYGSWNHKRHNNCRYAALLPRLRSVVPKYHTLSRFRLVAYLQGYIYHRIIEPWYVPMLARKYRGLFCTEVSQIRLFSGPIVVDIDDPVFDADIINILNDDRVLAVITTTELLRKKFISEGLQKPCYVIPSGVNSQDPEAVLSLQNKYSQQAETIRLGYAVPKFYLAKELTRSRHSPESMLRSIDWLLEVMQKVWLRNPNVELWLLGQSTRLVRQMCKTEKRIHLLGYIPYDDILPYYSLFDIALYPRGTDVQGRHSIKLLEYMTCGLPIVSTAVSEAFQVRDANAGMICSDQKEFVDSILKLSGSADLRNKLGKRGYQYAKAFSWNEIADKYDRVLEEIVKLN